MIVKVQLSLLSSAGKEQMLIYNEDRSVRYEAPADPKIKDLMGGRLKAYFTAELRPDGKLALGGEAMPQTW